MSRDVRPDLAELFLIVGLLAGTACSQQMPLSRAPDLGLEAASDGVTLSEEIPASPEESGATAPVERKTPSWKPFSSFAVALKIGTGGVGPEVATPLNRYMNLRGSFQIFDTKLHFRTSGIYSDADLTIQNAAAMVDFFPFHGGFHISPGVTIYGDNHLTSNLSVPGGTAFLLGPHGYTSDPNDPVTGVGRVKFGNPVAPRLTIGWGNLLPRGGRHFSVPFEVGFQYISPPTVQIYLSGSVCDPNKQCAPVSDGTEPQDLQTEINELQSDLAPLRFYPIVSIGISYKFGH